MANNQGRRLTTSVLAKPEALVTDAIQIKLMRKVAHGAETEILFILTSFVQEAIVFGSPFKGFGLLFGSDD
jgi:hypothetical protein